MAHYFAYTSMIDPDEIARVAPGARFHLIAHLPEAKMLFEMANGRWPGAIPTVVAEEGNSVWGAVFEVTKAQLAAIDAEEARNGRVPTQEFSAVDREGRRYRVATHVVADGTSAEPDHDYLEHMLAGCRHWDLPMGWMLNIEDILEDDLLA
jgi:gamma-glutamylcyclotransferase (GGCT)/AIG2-like uncharacterized protein YtfP